MSEMERRYLEAIKLVNVSDVARVTGRSLRSLQSYTGGQRNLTVEAAAELVEYLRTRAHALNQAADRLDAAITREKKKNA